VLFYWGDGVGRFTAESPFGVKKTDDLILNIAFELEK